MYLLQFTVFGAQTILLAGHMRYMGFSGSQVSWVYATGPATGSQASRMITTKSPAAAGLGQDLPDPYRSG